MSALHRGATEDCRIRCPPVTQACLALFRASGDVAMDGIINCLDNSELAGCVRDAGKLDLRGLNCGRR